MLIKGIPSTSVDSDSGNRTRDVDRCFQMEITITWPTWRGHLKKHASGTRLLSSTTMTSHKLPVGKPILTLSRDRAPVSR